MQKRGPQISELVGGVMHLQQLYKANEAKQTNQSYATPEHVDPGLGAKAQAQIKTTQATALDAKP